MDLGAAMNHYVTAVLACLFFVMIWKTMAKRKKLPPGPTPLPFIGNVLQLKTTNRSQALIKLSQQYGPVFTVYIGSQPTLVLSSYEVLKEALVNQGDVFNARAHVPVFQMINQGYGIVVTNGERWQQMHRFASIYLRNNRMGMRSIEELIQEEAQFLNKELNENKEIPCDPTFIITKAVSNIICSIIFGQRFDYKDEKFITLIQLMKKNVQFQATSWAQLLGYFPNIISHLPGPHHNFLKHSNKIRSYMKNVMKERQATLDLSKPQGLLDHFLIKMQQETHNPITEFSENNLMATIINLFVGGTETVSSTIMSGLKILMKNQDIQGKVHQEIDSVIGQNRMPCLEDQRKMPYTDAVIHEIQRFVNVAPMGIPHCVARDTTFRGYNIPKGMNVITLFTSLLFDPKRFTNPERFDPKHFLDDNGSFKKNEAFIPFSIGKRSCLGKGLARMELFLIFTTVLQNFTLKAAGDPEKIDISPGTSGVVNLSTSYQLCLFPR